MPFQPGHKLSVGNRGGRRMGYTYEKEQLTRLRKIADRGIAMIEAIQKGQVSDKEVEKYKVIEKALLKALDKLQPNKIDPDTPANVIIPIPILANVLSNNRNQENSILVEAHPGSPGGDSGQ